MNKQHIFGQAHGRGQCCQPRTLFSAQLVEGVAIGQSHALARLLRDLTFVIAAYSGQSQRHQSIGCFPREQAP
ncbi:hypothetical protein SPHINGOT1_80274 [Sphingomonas sp. T1]|nr:hypothetical protein SPHINGOT1_80274 [Sphingomonas sp. T1]